MYFIFFSGTIDLLIEFKLYIYRLRSYIAKHNLRCTQHKSICQLNILMCNSIHKKYIIINK